VDATDVNQRGLQALRVSLARLGLTCVRAHHADAASASGAAGAYDVVLLDAPCSGFGTLRQHPEIRWRRTPGDVDDLARRQRQLLMTVAGHVRPGGVLVYATCTIMQSENDGVIDAFLSVRSDFTIDDTAVSLPASARDWIDARGFLRTFPQHGGLDGFFAARLRRAR
jgi:16S rRNA (cytosine967-C5)-methyltransferase